MLDQSKIIDVLKKCAGKKFYAFLPRFLLGNTESEAGGEISVVNSDEYQRFCVGVIKEYERQFGELEVDTKSYDDIESTPDPTFRTQWVRMQKLNAFQNVLCEISDNDVQMLYKEQKTLLGKLVGELMDTTEVPNYESFLNSTSTKYGISVAQLSSFIVERNKSETIFPFFDQCPDAHIVSAYFTAISKEFLYNDGKPTRRIGLATLKTLEELGVDTSLKATQVSRRFQAVATPEEIKEAEEIIKNFTDGAAGNKKELISANSDGGLQTPTEQSSSVKSGEIGGVLEEASLSPNKRARTVGGGSAHGPNKVRYPRRDR